MQNIEDKQKKEIWQVSIIEEVNVEKPILLEGLPGVGNVGKIVVDYLIEEFKAKKIMSFFSYTLPNSVFVKEDNKVELPKIEIYHKKIKGKDYFFLTGDVQPVTEKGSYTFSEKILELMQERNCQKIITLGGIGLSDEPKNPTVYCTGNSDEIIKILKKGGANNDLYGLVGPIIGITGLLIGLSEGKGIPSAALLTETKGHPIKLGMKAANKSLEVLNNSLEMGLDMQDLEEKIKEMRESMNGEKNKNKEKLKKKRINETTYIG